MAKTDAAGNAMPTRADLAAPVRDAIDAAGLAIGRVDEILLEAQDDSTMRGEIEQSASAAKSAYAKLQQRAEELLARLENDPIRDEDGAPVDLDD